MDSQAGPEFWRKVLTEGHPPLRFMHALFRYLPSPPRCKVCHNPFGGIGGKLVALFGFTSSRKNPNVCVTCCERMPPGGAEVDIAVLFADVRGSTALGEKLATSAYAALLNRFYRAATEVLIRHDAIIDKLIGDEVMALFIRGICGPEYHRRAVEAGSALLQAVGYGQSGGPWLALGGAINSGMTYVGNVGSEGVVDFTALGDTVNTASRLASSAAGGEILLSETIYAKVAARFPNLSERTLSLRGKGSPINARILRAP
ncbi:MAG: adenylate/guanylate cyclase domain-containing protein [Deltaproteobacteria bacterium]|nr:adenylate/guanylate cyclase domain-containing protein [Deltaproteobacteria bacterium]